MAVTDPVLRRDASVPSIVSRERSSPDRSWPGQARGPKGKVVVLEDACKGCGLCTSACPFSLLVMSQHINVQGYHPAVFVDNEEECTACGLCFRTCPDCALEVYKLKKGVI